VLNKSVLGPQIYLTKPVCPEVIKKTFSTTRTVSAREAFMSKVK